MTRSTSGISNEPAHRTRGRELHMAQHQMPRRHFLGTVGAAGLGSAAIGLVPGAGRAEAAPSATEVAAGASCGHQAVLPYPTVRRPFAMPGVKEQDWTGALFVGTGESRFALRVALLTAQGKLLREKMTNYLWRIGPMTPDGAYKEVQVTTDDRAVMPAHLEALREVIAHPDQWSQSAVADATAKLPQLQKK